MSMEKPNQGKNVEHKEGVAKALELGYLSPEDVSNEGSQQVIELAPEGAEFEVPYESLVDLYTKRAKDLGRSDLKFVVSSEEVK